MNIIEQLNQLLEYVKSYGELPKNNNIDLNQISLFIYQYKDNLTEDQLDTLELIIKICNIIYENTNYVLLDDDFYDVLVDIYKSYRKVFPIGGEQIANPINHQISNIQDKAYPLIKYDQLNINDMLFYDELSNKYPLTKEDCIRQEYGSDQYISKRINDVEQSYPQLVGTLDKAKFVLSSQAIDKGVFNDPKVKIFERDFIGRHLQSGLFTTNDIITMVAELKYDGVSIAAEIISGNTIIAAYTRGDVNQGTTSDLSPIFKGFKFPHANEDETMVTFGMKFEAIITKSNLIRYNEERKTTYANGRTAIISILGSSDGWKYRDYITLIPIECTLFGPQYDRQTELEFLNRFYRNPEINKYAVIRGNYMQVLFQIKKFVEESEAMRDYIDYMYDGVVISYNDPRLRSTLGRSNSVNKYSIAIKFTPLKKTTRFVGYSYTVGQDGTITPMIHYEPVVFFGTVHTKSTGHSYARFKQLGLRVGDILEVEYVNDVMPYVSKPDIDLNRQNELVSPLVQFPDTCPSCGGVLTVSPSGKNIRCTNLDCPDRNINRIDNMFGKLGIKDFSKAYLSQIGKYTLRELLNVTVDQVSFLGEVNSQKFVDSMIKMKTEPIFDYKIVGSLGFTNVSTEKWKTILTEYYLFQIIDLNLQGEVCLRNTICQIKGIGPETANTIAKEFNFFKDDLIYICNMPNIVSIRDSLKFVNVKKIRFTGVRDKELVDYLNSLGHSAGEGAITKDTNYLIVPYINHNSSKTAKAIKYGIPMIPIDEFKKNLNYYLNAN